MARKARTTNVKGNAPASDSCFVIMPFGGTFDENFKEIYVHAIKDAGLKPIRVDDLSRPSSILADIWLLTRQAKVVLAIMTGQNPNVFYELGLAHAIAKPVVMVASSIDDVPFDLRGLRVLIYDTSRGKWGKNLQNRITKALKETLQDLNSAVPSTYLEAAPAPHAPKAEPVMLELRRLQDATRAIKISLAHWVPHLRVEAHKVEGYVKAFKYLAQQMDKQISLGVGMKIMSCIIQGRMKAATAELHMATTLNSEEAEDFIKELVEMAQAQVEQD